MGIAQTNITMIGFLCDMISNKIVVIRGRGISVIFYYSGVSGIGYLRQQYTTEYTDICGRGRLEKDLDKDTDTTCSWSSSGLGSESFSRGPGYSSVFRFVLPVFFHIVQWCG